MRGAVMHAAGDVRIEEREAPQIVEPTDAIIRVTAACATEVVEARGAEGVAAIKELTDGLGAHSVVEAVGTQESMNQALHATRPGGHMGFVGVGHGVALDGMEMFWSLAHVHGGPAPVRRFLRN
jgi:threonine dehydrogenase-like Zn-dependent dehydrogenase